MRIQFYFLLSLLTISSHCYSGEIIGLVSDFVDGNKIYNANIRVIETDQAVASDEQGNYTIGGIENGRYTLVVSHVAYDSLTCKAVDVQGIAIIDIALNPASGLINEIVVTGTRSPHLLKDVPVQTEVITRRDFSKTGATTVNEALKSIVGLTIEDDFAGQGAVLRGIEQDRVLVMVDGERAVGRVNGTIDLAQYSLSNVRKIEIVKGAGSTLYGSDAMGGVINIITNKPGKNLRRIEAFFDYGSFNSFNPRVIAEYGGNSYGFNIGGNLHYSDGFDLDKSTPQTDGEPEVIRGNLDAKFQTQISPHWKLSVSGRYMREKLDWTESEVRELSVIKDTTYVFYDEEINNRYEGSTTLDYLSGNGIRAKLRLFGTIYDHNWNKFGNNGNSWIDTSETKDKYFEAAYSSNIILNKNNMITFGVDYVYQDLISSEISFEKKANRSINGYLQYDYSPIQSISFLPGLRWENHNIFGSTVNPSLNVMYRASGRLKFRAYVGRGFRTPSIKQQYFIFDHTSAGYVVYGSEVSIPPELTGSNAIFSELKEENSINSSVSAEFSYGTIGLHRLTYFYNHLDNLIDVKNIGYTPKYYRGVFVYQNIETAVTQGIEYDSRVQLSGSIDFQLSYNYLHARDLTTDQPLTNRPEHTIKVNISGFYKKIGVGAAVWGDWQDRKIRSIETATDGNSDIDYAPDRGRLNINLFKRFGGKTEIFLRVKNIFDDTNLAYGYWPGREITIGFNYKFSINRNDN